MIFYTHNTPNFIWTRLCALLLQLLACMHILRSCFKATKNGIFCPATDYPACRDIEIQASAKHWLVFVSYLEEGQYFLHNRAKQFRAMVDLMQRSFDSRVSHAHFITPLRDTPDWGPTSFYECPSTLFSNCISISNCIILKEGGPAFVCLIIK